MGVSMGVAWCDDDDDVEADVGEDEVFSRWCRLWWWL